MSEGIWIAIIGLLGILIGGFFALKSLKATLKNNLDLAMIQMADKQKETHDLVNSRMTELLELTRKSSEAEGRLQGKQENADKPNVTGDSGSTNMNEKTE